jgi:hypothetical protein
MPRLSNLQIIKNVTTYWVTKQYDKIFSFLADDAVYEIGRGVLDESIPLFGTFRGKKQIERWYQTNSDLQTSPGFEPFCKPVGTGEFIDAGNQIVNFGRMPRSRDEPMCDWVALWTLKRGKITRCWLVLDTASVFVKWKKHNPNASLT